MIERKKNQPIPSLFWLAPLAPLLYDLQTMLFFSLFLVALEVQLYLRFLAAMGWEREELTVQRAFTLLGCMQHCENTFQTLKIAIIAIWDWTSIEKLEPDEYPPEQMWHLDKATRGCIWADAIERYISCSVEKVLLWKCSLQPADKAMAECLGQSYFFPLQCQR